MQRKAFEYDKGVVTFWQDWWTQLETLLATLGLNGWEIVQVEYLDSSEHEHRPDSKQIRWLAKRELTEDEAEARRKLRGMA